MAARQAAHPNGAENDRGEHLSQALAFKVLHRSADVGLDWAATHNLRLDGIAHLLQELV